jgi:hypothetical protein
MGIGKDSADPREIEKYVPENPQKLSVYGSVCLSAFESWKGMLGGWNVTVHVYESEHKVSRDSTKNSNPYRDRVTKYK